MASTPLRFTASRIPSPAITRLRGSAPWTTAGIPTAAGRRASSASSWEWVVTLRLCSKAGRDVGNVEESGDEPIGGEGTSGDQTETSFSSKELLQRLRRYGVVGVLSYGLLNTVYYLTTFLLVWFYFAPAPGRMGYAAAVERFLKVMAMVWASSQVTKIVRAGGALALAPFVARGLSWFTVKFKFESEGKAFAAIAGLCFGVAFILFLGLTFLWA